MRKKVIKEWRTVKDWPWVFTLWHYSTKWKHSQCFSVVGIFFSLRKINTNPVRVTEDLFSLRHITYFLMCKLYWFFFRNVLISFFVFCASLFYFTVWLLFVMFEIEIYQSIKQFFFSWWWYLGGLFAIYTSSIYFYYLLLFCRTC